MKSLTHYPNATPVFVLELIGPDSEKKYLHSIGISPEKIITIIKNPTLENSSQPIIIEINDARFMMDAEIAKNIIVAHALENQMLIFKGNKTPQRTAILEILKSFSDHFTLPELTRKIQNEFPDMGEITIYRSLKTLLEKGIIEEITLPNERIKYEVKKGHHEHIFCQQCGNLIEFYSSEMEALQHEIAKQYGVSLLSHQVTLIAGACPKCSE